jgi:hypothetical protein
MENNLGSSLTHSSWGSGLELLHLLPQDFTERSYILGSIITPGNLIESIKLSFVQTELRESFRSN